MKRLRILHLEDSPLDAELIHAALIEGGLECEIARVQTRADFAAALRLEPESALRRVDWSAPLYGQ